MKNFQRYSILWAITSLSVIIFFSIIKVNYFIPVIQPFVAIITTIASCAFPFVAVYLTAKSYLLNNNTNLLLMSNGILIFVLGSAISTWIVFMVPNGTNVAVTTQNLSALGASAFQIAAAMWENNENKSTKIQHRRNRLAFTVIGSCIFFAVVLILAMFNKFPVFFDQNGPTELRQTVLLVSVIFYFFASMLFLKQYVKRKSDYHFWYFFSLLMLTFCFLAFINQHTVNEPLAWIGRLDMYSGGMFAFVSILTVFKEAKKTNSNFSSIINDFFEDAEENYKSLVETSNDAIISVDHNHCIFIANSAAEKLFGYEHNELIGFSILELLIVEDKSGLLPEELEIIKKPMELSPQVKTSLIDAKKKNGENFPIEISISVRKLNEDYICTYIIRDITGRKNMEKFQTFQAHMLVSLQEAICAVDENFNITFWNEMAEKIFGWTAQEAIGNPSKEIFKMISPSNREESIDNILKNSGYAGEAIYRNKDGKAVHASVICSVMRDAQGNYKGNVSSFRDITERKRIEEALRNRTHELEKLNRQKTDILESISDCFYALDKDLRFIYANRAAEEIWGLSRDDLIGCSIEDVFTGLIDISLSKFRNVLEKQIPEHYEVFSKVAQRWGTMSVYPTSDGISVYFHDITERKLVEEALRENEEKYSSLFYSTPAAMSLRLFSGPYVNVNDAFSKLFGFTHEEFTGKISIGLDIYPNPDQQHEIARTIQESGLIRNYEVQLRRKDGALFNALFSGDLVVLQGKEYILGTTLDITERKWAEEVLRESEAAMREQADFMRKINIVHEKAMNCGSLEELGSACLKIIESATQSAVSFIGEISGDGLLYDIAISETGWAESTMYDQSGHRRPPGKFPIRGLYGSVLKSGKSLLSNAPASHPESAGLPAGHPRITSFLGVPFLQGKKVVGMVAVANRESGYTEKEKKLLEALTPTILEVLLRKRAEEALSESEKKAIALVTELEEADKNKNQFISVLSHELRNPLAAITAGLSLIEMTDGKEQTSKAMEIINRQTGQLCKLVDDLLDLTRINQNKIKLKKDIILLNEVVIHVAEDAKTEFDKKCVELIQMVHPQPLFVYADPVRITQCIGNILYNALKFTQDKGTVWLSLQQEKNNAVITVQDNGIGISPDLIANLFKPFVQGDYTLHRQNSNGLGLGLSIVKGIVDMHGGSVEASSEGLGEGALFTIRLPISAE